MNKVNLTDLPWIPVLSSTGKKDVSLRECFSNADSFESILGDNPLITGSIYRFLFAVLQRALVKRLQRSDWKETVAGIVASKRFPDDVGKYLDKWHGRFFLFDAKHPFMQTPGLMDDPGDSPLASKKRQHIPVVELAQEIAGGRNFVFFDHHSGKPEEVDPATCARWIVAQQAYTVKCNPNEKSTAKYGPTKHAPGVIGAMALISGHTLLETLALNLVKSEHPVEDVPSWESDPPQPTGALKGLAYGPASLYSWLSRRILVQQNSNGNCEWARVEAGYELKSPGMDHLFFRSSKQDGPAKFEHGRNMWRDSLSLIEKDKRPVTVQNYYDLRELHPELGLGQNPRFEVIGIINDKSKVLGWGHARMPIPAAFYNDPVLVGMWAIYLKQVEGTAKALRSAANTFVFHADCHESVVESIMEVYWIFVDDMFVPDIDKLEAESATVTKDAEAKKAMVDQWYSQFWRAAKDTLRDAAGIRTEGNGLLAYGKASAKLNYELNRKKEE